MLANTACFMYGYFKWRIIHDLYTLVAVTKENIHITFEKCIVYYCTNKIVVRLFVSLKERRLNAFIFVRIIYLKTKQNQTKHKKREKLFSCLGQKEDNERFQLNLRRNQFLFQVTCDGSLSFRSTGTFWKRQKFFNILILYETWAKLLRLLSDEG